MIVSIFYVIDNNISVVEKETKNKINILISSDLPFLVRI